MPEDVAEFLAVELGVDGHGDAARMPDAEERLEIVGAVAHDDGDALSWMPEGFSLQRAGNGGGACRPVPIGRMHDAPRRDGGRCGKAPPIAGEPSGNIHRRAPVM